MTITDKGPGEFELLGNYPNPFNPSTSIRIRLNNDYVGPLEIRIYNELGQLVRVLRLEVRGRGIYTILWDGTGKDGLALSSGMYIYAVDFRNTVLVGRMIMLK